MAGSISMPGLSGIDTGALLDALMSVERQRLTLAQTAQAKINARTAAWNTIGGKLSTLGTSAATLASSYSFLTKTITSSDPTKVSATGSMSGPAISFGVSQLAASGLWSVTGLSSTVAEVGAGTLTLSKGLSALGITAADGLSAGDHDIAVTQAASRAEVGSGVISGATTITTTNRTLSLTMTTPSGSVTKNLTLTTGTYATAQDLADEINARIAATPGASGIARVSGGALVIENDAGMGSDFAVSASGTFATSVGFGVGTFAGTDALVSVDGVVTNVGNVAANSIVTVNSLSGPVDLTIGAAGTLSVGSSEVTTLSFGAGTTIDQVAAAVNSAGVPVTASVVGTPGSAQMLLASKESGAAASTSVTWAGFAAGSAQLLRQGQDAVVTMGAQSITRSSNVVTDLIPGVTLTLQGTTTSDITITPQTDTASALANVKTFVDALNDTLKTVATHTKTNPDDITKAGVLVSDSAARSLSRSLVSAMGFDLGASATYRSMSSIGIQIQRDGTYKVDETAFKAAMANDAEAVSRVLSRSIDNVDSRMKLGFAPNTTVEGSYDVFVTQAAARATVTGVAFGTLAAPETITVTLNGQSAAFDAQIGMNATQVAAGISVALANAGIGAFADVTAAGQIRVLANNFGSAYSISVASTGASTGLGGLTAAGLDVAGTIDGVAASGSGRSLTSTAGPSDGLSLVISASAADVAGAGGSLYLGAATYTAGAAGLLRNAVSLMTGVDGSVTTAKDSLAQALRRSNDEIDRINRHLAMTQERLAKQFAALDTIVAGLNRQMASIAGILPKSQ